MITALNCPICGAPLKVSPHQTRAICIYCSSTIQIDHEQQAAPSAALELTLPEADMAKIKQLLLDGQPQAAEKLYIQISGANPAAAQEALADLKEKLSLDVVRQQQLSPMGFAIVFFYALIFLVGLLGWGSGRMHWLPSLALVLLGAWMLYFYFPAVVSTLKFRRGKQARAQVIKLAEVGRTRLGRGRVHVLSLLVEVHPDQGDPPYQAEILLPVREENITRAQPGTSIRVKYLPDQPEEIIYQE